MNAQKRDLVSSRHYYETQGDVFGCAECGDALPPVSTGHTSDYCESCEPVFDDEGFYVGAAVNGSK